MINKLYVPILGDRVAIIAPEKQYSLMETSEKCVYFQLGNKTVMCPTPLTSLCHFLFVIQLCTVHNFQTRNPCLTCHRALCFPIL